MPPTKSDQFRTKLREEMFGPEAWDRAWQGPDERGFACVPRVLPILLKLAHDSKVTGNRDCRSVYVELLSQNWGQAIVEVRDEQAHALRSGYASKRGVRTWQERIEQLESQGFIEVQPKSVRRIGYILLRHPNLVILHLRKEGKVRDSIWRAYMETCREFGLKAPEDPRGMSKESSPT